MADLEDAAAQALSQLKSLETAMEKTQAGMDEVEHEVERLASQLETDWSTFDHAAESLLEKARSVQHALDTAEQQTTASLHELQEKIASGYHEVAEDAQHAVAEIGSLEQEVHADAPDIASHGQAISSQSKALSEHAAEVAGHLETTFQQVAHFLEHDVVGSLRSMKDAVHEASQKVRDDFHHTAEEQLQTVQQEYDRHLDELDEVLHESLGAAALHVPAVVEYVTKECEEAHKTHANEMAHVADSLHTVVEKLEAAIAAEERTAREASQNVGHACTNTDHAAATMIQALGSVRDLLAKLSFV
jgi:DNA repair exonuclease SbcCD ATPase subunit